MPGDGPIPKRSDQRRRRNKPAAVESISKAPAAPLPPVPAGDPGWHPLAGEWFEALGKSGQARFYEPSDWAMAKVWATVLSKQLEASRISAQMIAAWAAGATELLTTEGARRRARVELERESTDADEEASVTAIDRYRAEVGA